MTVINQSIFLRIGSVFLLAGCALTQQETGAVSNRSTAFADTQDLTKGVVILESAVVGESSAYTASLGDSDCTKGRGLGVMTSSVQGDNRFLFDQKGKPCSEAVTLFDGKLKPHRRAADPSVKVAFIDKYGEVPSQDVAFKTEDAIVVDMTAATLPEEMVLEEIYSAQQKKNKEEAKKTAPLQGQGDAFYKKLSQVADVNVDASAWAYQKEEALTEQTKKQKNLQETIQKWHAERERKALVRDAEKLLSGARNLERKSSHELISEHQKEITTLLARLREAEKVQAYQREREKALQDHVLSLQATLSAQAQSQVQKETALEEEISVLSKRAEGFKQQAQSVQADKKRNEKQLSKRIASLKKELMKAQKSTEKSQQKLLLEAAEQLAKAEAATQTYHAKRRAHLEKQAHQKETEARYLTAQAESISLEKPMVLPQFSQIAFMEKPESKLEERLMMLEKRVKALQAPTYNHQNLAENGFAGAHVRLNVKDQPLENILKQALAQAMPDKTWTMEWALSKHNASIKEEKWTVIAEARMDEILAYIKEKVKKAHKVDIEFRRFNAGKLFVISDISPQE